MDSDMDVDSPFVWDWRSGAAIAAVLVVGSLANSAGVGGGAIFIPILQALVGFGLKDATAVSQAMITAGSIVSVLINIFKRSPQDPSAPLIHFSVALALTPVVLAGVAVGVLLNTVFPPWLITILLLVLMVLLVLQSTNKAIMLWKAETRARQVQHTLSRVHTGDPNAFPLTPLSAHPIDKSHRGADSWYLKGLRFANHGTAWGYTTMPADVFDSLACLEGSAVEHPGQPHTAAGGQTAGVVAAVTPQGRRRMNSEELTGVSYDCMEGCDVVVGPWQSEAGTALDGALDMPASASPGMLWPARTASGQAGPSGSPAGTARPGRGSGPSSVTAASRRAVGSASLKLPGGRGGPDTDNYRLRQPLLALEDGGASDGTGSDGSGRVARRAAGAVAGGSGGGNWESGESRRASMDAGGATGARGGGRGVNSGPRGGGGLPPRRARLGSGTGVPELRRIAEHVVDVQPGAADQSWLSRRSKWRSHMFAGMGELGSVPTQPMTLLDRAMSRHLSTSQLTLDLNLGRRGPTLDAHQAKGVTTSSRDVEEGHAVVHHPLEIPSASTSGEPSPSSLSQSVPAASQLHWPMPSHHVPPNRKSGAGPNEDWEAAADRWLGPRGASATWRLRPIQPPLPQHESEQLLSLIDSLPSVNRPPVASPSRHMAAPPVAARVASSTPREASIPREASAPRVGALTTVPADGGASSGTSTGRPSAPSSANSTTMLLTATSPPQQDSSSTLDAAPTTLNSTTAVPWTAGAAATTSHAATAAAAVVGAVDSPVRPGPPTRLAAAPGSQGGAPPPGGGGGITAALRRVGGGSEGGALARSASLGSGMAGRAVSRLGTHPSLDGEVHPGPPPLKVAISEGRHRGRLRRAVGLISPRRVAKLSVSVGQLAVQVAHVMRSDLELLPGRTLAAMGITWLAFSGLQVGRSVVERCSGGYWALLIIQLLLMLGVSIGQAIMAQRAALAAAAADAADCTADTAAATAAATATASRHPSATHATATAAAAAATTAAATASRHPSATPFSGGVGTAPLQRSTVAPSSHYAAPDVTLVVVAADAEPAAGTGSGGVVVAAGRAGPAAGTGPGGQGGDNTHPDRGQAADDPEGSTADHPAASAAHAAHVHPHPRRPSPFLAATAAGAAGTKAPATPAEGSSAKAAEETNGPAGKPVANGGHAAGPEKLDRRSVKAEGSAAAAAEAADEDKPLTLGDTASAVVVTLLIACLAGLVGGMLGLGGGMLIGPLLLELGAHPQVSAATSSLMVLFSSSAALVGFVVLGRLNVPYSLVLGGFSGLASILGVSVVASVVRRTGRISVVVFCLSLVMIIALACIASFGILTMIQTFSSGTGIGFSDLCA